MNLKDQMGRFNKRWDVVAEDSYEEAFKKFKTRVSNIFKDIDEHVTDNGVTAFCQYYAIEVVWRDSRNSAHIINRLLGENREKEFYRLIEVILSLDMINESDGFTHSIIYYANFLFKSIADVIEISDVNVAIGVSDSEVILYPKGEKKLDEELVNLPLSFLDKNSGDHFIQALQSYQSKNHIRSAESLRRSLEEFFKCRLKNTKCLKANVADLQVKLKGDKGDPQIRNIIQSTFSYLDQYFNENSKHNDGNIDDSENEFLIYQTGLLMRYINNEI
jgi:hypothetical protein